MKPELLNTEKKNCKCGGEALLYSQHVSDSLKLYGILCRKNKEEHKTGLFFTVEEATNKWNLFFLGDIKEDKDVKICEDIGCSGMDDTCPGNPNCDIIRKIDRESEKLKGFNDFIECVRGTEK